MEDLDESLCKDRFESRSVGVLKGFGKGFEEFCALFERLWWPDLEDPLATVPTKWRDRGTLS